MELQNDRVRFNVGGRIFETTFTTLAKAGRNSFFGAMFDDNWDLQLNSTEHFIDRNPACFSILLDLLRTGQLHIPPKIPEKLLYTESSFYGLLDHVRAAQWVQLDRNRLHHLTRSIQGRVLRDGNAIRAGPHGGCCVAHGSLVHVYDWMLDEHPTINLNYRRINNVLWVDSESIVVSSGARWDDSNYSGLGLISSSSGELRYMFYMSHENQNKSFSSGALSFNPDDYKLFSSCSGMSTKHGIDVWDLVTGKQIDFFYDQWGGFLGEADKLQWMSNTNCLLAATLYPSKGNHYINLLDFRDKSRVSCPGLCDNGRVQGTCNRRVRDVIALEETNSICVVSDHEELGFVDLRQLSGNVDWRRRGFGRIPLEPPLYSKIAYHAGQLFVSVNDSISVFCGPNWTLTSRLRNGSSGSICNLSMEGDRLFALHREEDVFDMWETRPVILCDGWFFQVLGLRIPFSFVVFDSTLYYLLLFIYAYNYIYPLFIVYDE